MTFNEGMQIDTSTTSASGGGRGIAIGGGLGGLLFLVVALLLGVDPGKVVNQLPTNTTQDVAPGFDLSKCKTGADANQYAQCRVIATGNSVDAVWKQLMHGYTRPHVRLFSGQVSTGCGPASTEVGPFYCPVDQTAYFDTGFFDVLRTQFGSSGGPLAQEYVVAHEFGHHVQDLQGSLGPGSTGCPRRGRQRRAHRAAGRLLRRGVGALRLDDQAGKHGGSLPRTAERQGHRRRAVGGGIGGR